MSPNESPMMSHTDPISTRPSDDFISADEEIELEPTVQYPGGYPSSPSQSFHMALATSSMPSLTTETEELRRSRLKAAAVFLAFGFAVFLIFGLLDPGSAAGMNVLNLGLRVLLCTRSLACWQARSI